MPQAVIFDMDGVLVDSYQAHFASWQRMYRELVIPYTEADFAADFGRTTREILARKFGDQLSEERIREIDHRKEAYYREDIEKSFREMDGARELIDALHAAGFLLAVGTSGPAENVTMVLKCLGKSDKLKTVVTGADVTRGKPDPQVFQIAAQRLGVPPAQCLVIEDAVHGVEAAHRAGMACVALTGTASREGLAAADLVVDSLRELTPDQIASLIARISPRA
jgi:beta-phosphoglucomutase